MRSLSLVDAVKFKMKVSKRLSVTDRESWRAWLVKNSGTEREVWLIYHKKHTGRPSVAYEDAVEEALCFGWIDSVVQRIDEKRYAQKFTPRKAGSQWSESNKRRVRKLIREDRMNPVGLAKIPETILTDKGASTPGSKKKALALPRSMKQAIGVNRRAWENFNHLAPSYQRQYVGWIMAAKREETLERRLQEAIVLLSQGRKLGMK